jgi:NADPH-dependent glutamate synthase beta subunit-like oxidoreductase
VVIYVSGKVRAQSETCQDKKRKLKMQTTVQVVVNYSRHAMMSSVAVIGAGPQGLVTAKNLLEEGFQAKIFEARPSIGGLWQHREDAKWTSVFPSTLGNVSKYRNCFTD